MEENSFISVTSLLCEPSRAKIVWSLLDGRAYTAGELALVSDLSATAVSNHLSKLLHGNIVKVAVQGRHRYYSFASPEVAYVVEAMANLAELKPTRETAEVTSKRGVRYCRTCYDHLAGYVGVTIVDAMEVKGYLNNSDSTYHVAEEGWNWFAQLGISEDSCKSGRRPLTRQCLDWSERRPHLAGSLGAHFLEMSMQANWFKKIRDSREMIVTSKGRKALCDHLGIDLS